MISASIQLYKNAFSGLSPQMWWLALVVLINRAGTMVILFLSVYLTKKGFTLLHVGYIMAAFGLGAILGAFLGGKLTDRFGHFYVQVFSLIANGLFFILLGQMQTFWEFIICIFFLSSLGEAFRPANSAAIAEYSNESNRTRCYALNRLAINLGWSLGPAIGGILASINYSLLFWADGLTCILAAVMLYYIFLPKKKIIIEKKETVAPSVTNSAYKDKPFLLGMFYIFLVGICFFQMFSILSIYYRDVLNMNEVFIGLLMGFNGLIIVLFEMILVYKLENKRHVSFYLSVGAFLIGLSFLMLNLSPIILIAVLSMILITFGEMLLFPFMNNFWVRRSSEKNRGQFAAVYTMAFSAALVLAPTFASQVATRFGYPILWMVNFAICSVAALGFLILKKQI